MTVSKTPAQRYFLCNSKQIHISRRDEKRNKLSNIVSNFEVECFAITYYWIFVFITLSQSWTHVPCHCSNVGILQIYTYIGLYICFLQCKNTDGCRCSVTGLVLSDQFYFPVKFCYSTLNFTPSLTVVSLKLVLSL